MAFSKSIFCATILDNPFIPHKPTIKQAEFLIHDELEGLYGGSAGGGKTDALLMSALQFCEYENYSALILRRTYKDLSLPEAILDRAKDWLIGKAKWDEMDKVFTFPSKAKLTFGHLEYDRAKYQYQGARFDAVFFDELTQFPETSYLYLFSRIRRAEDSNIPPRMRCGSNPGGVGHEWVKQRFITSPDLTRCFVPASLKDNPYVDQEAYLLSLSKLDPVTRAQLELGDWDISFSGGMFKREWFRIVDDYPHDAKLVRAWDLAATEKTGDNDPDWTAGLLLAEKDGIYYVVDVQHAQSAPGDIESLITQTAMLDPKHCDIFMEQEPGSAGVNVINRYARDVLKGFSYKGIRTSGPKVVRAKPVSAAASNGNIRIVRGYWNKDFLNELSLFPTAKIHDDQVDALSLAFDQIQKPREVVAVSLKSLHTKNDASGLEAFFKKI